MALHSLVVEHFRGIRSARVSFDPSTLLFGENGSGKSSLLEAIAVVLAFELLASVAAAGSAGPPAPLRRTIETCVELARESGARGLTGRR